MTRNPARRRWRVAAALAAAAWCAGQGAPAAQAAEDIVLGASIPLTGVFGFAGRQIHDALTDYTSWLNEQGGIKGRKLRYVMEDTGYKVDASVAAFKKITANEDPVLYYGDSTGFQKAINAELTRLGTMLMGGTSFASDIAHPERFPFQFISGPTYTEMFGILLEHIRRNAKPGERPTVAFVYSDTEFGRDPIEGAKAIAKRLDIEVALEIVASPANVDVSTSVLKLRRVRPGYVIFHGYVLAPIPEFIQQARQMGLTSTFMGTFWSMDKSTVDQMGPNAEGFVGVMPYRYFYDAESAPMLRTMQAYSRKRSPDVTYRHVAYTQAWLTAMILTEAVERTLDAGKPLTGRTLEASLASIKDWDTGGIVGVPVTIRNHSIPVGRIYRANASKGRLEPISDWIVLD